MGRGRPILGAIFGLVFGLSLAVVLLFFGTFALESVMVLVLPLLFLVVGGALGYFAPLGVVARR